MATVTINAGSVLMTIRNLSQSTLAISNAVLAPQQSKDILANRIVGVYQRAFELSELVRKGYITVTVNNTVLTHLDLLNLDAVLDVKAVYADANRPAATDNAVGTTIFNTDDDFNNITDGTNWRDPTGAIT
jgi:hypothetical protein